MNGTTGAASSQLVRNIVLLNVRKLKSINVAKFAYVCHAVSGTPSPHSHSFSSSPSAFVVSPPSAVPPPPPAAADTYESFPPPRQQTC